MRKRLFSLFTLFAAVAFATAACSSISSEAASPVPSGSLLDCTPSALHLYKPGQLTVATDSPAYSPWFISNTPSNGKGFESAVAYAVAKQLGFQPSQVKWVVQGFGTSFAPGPKNFDFDINEISITPQRAQAVTFSIGYYSDHQALIALKGEPITKVTSMSELKTYKLGAQVGTTSLSYIAQYIQPTQQAAVYNSTNDLKSALVAHQIDGFLTDVASAVYIANAQVPNGVVVGQFPEANPPEEFGLLFQKGNPLVACVDQALQTLKSNGTLTQLQNQWIPPKYNPPTIPAT
jgi:polar amino acid transport system substrate-binding protein